MKSSPLIFLFYISLLSFMNCRTSFRSSVLTNESLPKDIKLKNEITKITDSAFAIKNEIRILETIIEFNLIDGILSSRSIKSFDNDTIQSSFDSKCDENGNFIETLDRNGRDVVTKKTQIIRDEFGNMVSLKVIQENKKTIILKTENKYKNKNLVKSETKNQNNLVINSINYEYDSDGNLTKESGRSSVDFTNTNTYDKNGNLILHKHFRYGSLEDSTLYFYSNNLLVKKEWHQSMDGEFYNPMIFSYTYNEDNVLIKEAGSRDINYEGLDSNGNWREKTVSSYGKSHRVTTRKIVYTH